MEYQKWLNSEKISIHGVEMWGNPIFKTYNLDDFRQLADRLTKLDLPSETIGFDARI